MCTGPRGASSGRGGGGGLVKGPAGMVGTTGATAEATGQAPLCGAGASGGRPRSPAELLHAQSAGLMRPGARHTALGGE